MIMKSLAHPRTPPAGDRPCACYGGLVFVGHLVEDGSGEEVEVVEAVPCGRCAGGIGAAR